MTKPLCNKEKDARTKNAVQQGQLKLTQQEPIASKIRVQSRKENHTNFN
jgi:hypothetical protein